MTDPTSPEELEKLAEFLALSLRMGGDYACGMATTKVARIEAALRAIAQEKREAGRPFATPRFKIGEPVDTKALLEEAERRASLYDSVSAKLIRDLMSALRASTARAEKAEGDLARELASWTEDWLQAQGEIEAGDIENARLTARIAELEEANAKLREDLRRHDSDVMTGCEACGAPLYDDDEYVGDDCKGCWAVMTDNHPSSESKPCYAYRVGKPDARALLKQGEG